jgi:uncharacterized membrane protein YagU involved in acid resistance
MDYLGLAAAIAAATFWYKGAEMEKVNPLYWAGPSVILSALAIFALQRGWLGVILGQVALLVGITIFRVLRDKPQE